MRGKFIVVEGLSAVGKSTVVRLLAEELDAEFMRSIPSEFNDLRKSLDAKRSINPRFCLLLAAIFYVAEEIEPVLQSGKNIVVESYIYRTIAFHHGMGATLQIELPMDFTVPDYIFLLACEEGERQRRRKSRMKNGKEYYWERLAEDNTMKIIEEYLRFPVHIVDTTRISPSEVVKIIQSHIEKPE